MDMNKIYNMDCLEGMKKLPNDSIDLTVTSPPYDKLRKYKGFSWDFKSVAKELYRITKPGGVVVWIVSDSTINGSETGTSFKQALFFKEIGFNIYDTMIWLKPSPAAPTESRYYDVFEYMFILSKGRPKTLNLLCDRKNKSAGNVSNCETRSGREQRRTLSKKRVVKEYSRRLANDHILSWSNKGDVVLDPFCGSGTTAKMAMLTGRKFIGFEISAEYCDIAEKRIASVGKDIPLFEAD